MSVPISKYEAVTSSCGNPRVAQAVQSPDRKKFPPMWESPRSAVSRLLCSTAFGFQGYSCAKPELSAPHCVSLVVK